jgi:ubiquinone/menaquinone biosynthesis C-methylase UbiE
MEISDYWKLLQYAYKRLKSKQDYREFQFFQGELLIKYLHSKSINLTNLTVLDLGCGYGGYSLAFKSKNNKVLAIDRFNVDEQLGVDSLMSDAVNLPLLTESFDLIICASLIEHVARPKSLLKELRRVIKPDGYVYLSFPPFYSLLGGHQFSPFHYLGEKLALRLMGLFRHWDDESWLGENYPTSPDSFSAAYGDWGLYVMTIKKFNSLVKEVDFLIMESATRFLPFDFSGLPYLGEILTWHVQYLLRKE